MRFWACFFTAAFLAAGAQAADAPSTRPALSATDIFILLRPEEKEANWHVPTLLERELVRQAMLMAARDHLGLYTRDEVLRERAPGDIGDLSARTAALNIAVNSKTESLDLQFTTNGTTVTASVPRTLVCEWVVDLPPLVARAEELSRTNFVDWLKVTGFNAVAAANAADAPVPAKVEKLLTEMSIFSQYNAVRQVHALVRLHGPSAALRGALVRGYANLGQLTRFHWTASADVFTARSLLYAQAMVADNPKSAFALWHRAYAMSMAGLHAAAMKDLAAAADAPQKTDPPAWLPLIEAVCHYQTAALADGAVKDPANAPLAWYLTFLTVENSGSTAAVMTCGKAVLEVSPSCARIVDAMVEHAGVSYGHWLTEGELSMTVRDYRASLPRIQDLPANVADAWQAAHKNPDLAADVADVSQAFVDAPDAAEPSWSALGRLLQETNFIHVFRRSYFMARMWCVDPSEFVGQTAPLVKGHPLAPLIEAISASFNRSPLPEGMGELQIPDPTQRITLSMPFYGLLSRAKEDWKAFYAFQNVHLDATAWDYELRILCDDANVADPDVSKWRSGGLRKISPDSPVGAAAIVHWKQYKPPELDELTKKFQGQPAFDAALARQYLADNKPDDAIVLLQSYVKVAPDRWAFEKLAELYLNRDDEANWLATLQTALNQEDYGLDQARINVEIANHFMEQGRYAQAQPYADAAAESWAEWAMACAARCRAGLKQWDVAETWWRNINDRYGPGFGWYEMCLATGHGDLATARRTASARLQNHPEEFRYLAIYAGAEGDPDGEIANVKKIFTHYQGGGDPFAGLWLAMLYDQQHDAARRDATLAPIVQNGPAYDAKQAEHCPEHVELAKLLQAAYLHGNQFDMVAFEKLCQNLSPPRRADVYFFAAKFLESHDQQTKALEMLPYVTRHLDWDATAGLLAAMDLVAHHVDPYPPAP